MALICSSRPGLPDTKGWTYVELAAEYNQQNDALAQITPSAPVLGRAWLEAKPGADGQIHIATGAEISVFLPSEEGALPEKIAEQYKRLVGQGHRVVVGKVKPADEAKDAAALVRWTEDLLVASPQKDQLLQNGDALKQLFYQAAHWHRRGLTKEGDALLLRLLEALPRRESLVEMVLADLAAG